MKAWDYLEAARVPHTLRPQEFGLWQIERLFHDSAVVRALVGWPDQTLLCRWTAATIKRGRGEIVMEDSFAELSRHLPIWFAARGRVLVTGLGLGCVVRGLRANPDVERVDVVEIDADIIRVIWPEFRDDDRLHIHHGDALKIEWSPDSRWDFAWHDLWTEGKRHLQVLHSELIQKHWHQCPRQGAWGWPREMKRRMFRKLSPQTRHRFLGMGR